MRPRLEAVASEAWTLRNVKAVDVVSVGLRGDDLNEWRARVRVAFLIECEASPFHPRKNQPFLHAGDDHLQEISATPAR